MSNGYVTPESVVLEQITGVTGETLPEMLTDLGSRATSTEEALADVSSLTVPEVTDVTGTTLRAMVGYLRGLITSLSGTVSSHSSALTDVSTLTVAAITGIAGNTIRAMLDDLRAKIAANTNTITTGFIPGKITINVTVNASIWEGSVSGNANIHPTSIILFTPNANGLSQNFTVNLKQDPVEGGFSWKAQASQQVQAGSVIYINYFVSNPTA